METATFSGRRGIAYRRAVPARVPGWRLVLDKPGIVPVGHGFANIVPDDAATVLGVLYEIRTVELDHLDLSEGVLIGNYRRVEVVAETLTSRATKVGAQTSRRTGATSLSARPRAIWRVSSPARSSTGCPPRTSSGSVPCPRARKAPRPSRSALSSTTHSGADVEAFSRDHCAPRVESAWLATSATESPQSSFAARRRPRSRICASTRFARRTKRRERAGSVAARSISRRACANSAATSAGTRAVVHPAIIRGSTPRAQRAAARGSVSDRQQRLR